MTIEDREYIGIPGDIFLFRPKIEHSIQMIDTMRLRQPHIHFDLFFQDDSLDTKVSFQMLEHINKNDLHKFRRDIFKNRDFFDTDHIRPENPVIVEQIIFNIIKEFEMKIPYHDVHMKGLFIQLLVHLLRENYWKQNPQLFSNMNDLYKIQTYLKLNISKKVHLDELSDLFGISKYHLTRLFKKAFGKGPIQYHQMCRLQKAKEKIQFTDLSITDIAEEFGFENIQTFSRAFKENEGVPPTFYRKP